ncbi:hypothetical protein E2C01_009317 [Portunus trituberculatus]|uniref:Uncharacterized protein n=1 Tax=Portunus trituberculatus TaxID=210409 RepID=A0A5B7D375_PORTR|nr:hypothetical protein [Portunus trituberculatus]
MLCRDIPPARAIRFAHYHTRKGVLQAKGVASTTNLALPGTLDEWTTRACHQSPVSTKRGRCSLKEAMLIRI